MRKEAYLSFWLYPIRKNFKALSGIKNLRIIIVLLFMILICCGSPAHHKVLGVPFAPQNYLGWCDAACVQMWAKYDGYDPAQEDIASYMGWGGASPHYIALGVSNFTNESGWDKYFPGS